MLHYTSLCLVALQQFPKFFFQRERSATREINGKSSFAQSGFLSYYLQPSKPPVLLCFRGLSRTVPNAAACLARILKLSLRVCRKTFHKSNKEKRQSCRRPEQSEQETEALIGPNEKHICKKVFQMSFFPPRTEESAHMSAKYRPTVSKHLLLDQNASDRMFSSKGCFEALPCRQPHQQQMLKLWCLT